MSFFLCDPEILPRNILLTNEVLALGFTSYGPWGRSVTPVLSILADIWLAIWQLAVYENSFKQCIYSKIPVGIFLYKRQYFSSTLLKVFGFVFNFWVLFCWFILTCYCYSFTIAILFYFLIWQGPCNKLL